MVEMTLAELQAQLAKLQGENAALKAARSKAPGVTIKVGKAGGVCIYGLGRFPTTLYAGQMERLLDHADKIREFIKVHAAELKRKE